MANFFSWCRKHFWKGSNKISLRQHIWYQILRETKTWLYYFFVGKAPTLHEQEVVRSYFEPYGWHRFESCPASSSLAAQKKTSKKYRRNEILTWSTLVKARTTGAPKSSVPAKKLWKRVTRETPHKTTLENFFADTNSVERIEVSLDVKLRIITEPFEHSFLKQKHNY